MSVDAVQAGSIDRREFVAELLGRLPDALVVSGLGSPTYDVFSAGDRDRNFYLWGAMGGAAMIGLGLAIARPAERVLVVTGDGEMLMGLGALATIGAQRPANLSIVVLDNGHYGETGMQRSHTSLGTDLAAVARACGLAEAMRLDGADAARRVAGAASAARGPVLAQVLVRPDELARALPPRDGVHVKNRFRATLGLAPI